MTTKTLVAGIAQLPEPCWGLPNDDLTHYPDEQAALDVAEDDQERHDQTKPTQMSDRCWVAQAACGKWVDADSFQIAHHLTPGDAYAAARDQDFEVNAGVLRCDDGDLCKSAAAA